MPAPSVTPNLSTSPPGQALGTSPGGRRALQATDERQVLEAIAAAGSGWPASWAAGTAEGPCGAGWDSYTEGWVGVRCGAAGGSVSRISRDSMPDPGSITGDVSSLSQLTEITFM